MNGPDWPGAVIALVVLLTVMFIMRFREVRQARWDARQDAIARHPSQMVPRQPVPRGPVPGLPDDGEPLTDDELRQYLGIMIRSTQEPGRRAP